MSWCTIDDFFEAYRTESRLAAAIGVSKEESDRILHALAPGDGFDFPEEYYGDDFPHEFADAGVSSSVLALSVFGATTITACNGTINHSEGIPQVGFWAEEQTLKGICRVANRSGVVVDVLRASKWAIIGLTQFVVGTPEGLCTMRNFAIELVKEHLLVHAPERLQEIDELVNSHGAFAVPEWLLPSE